MNDTLANITKTLLGNADGEMGVLFPASPLSPQAVLPSPFPHSDA